MFSGGSGNGDEDPDKRPTENKPLGGCSSDDGVCAGAQEEQLADQSAGMELVPGTSKGRWKAYKERTVDLDVGRDAGVMGPQARPVIQYQPFPPLDLSRQQVNPNPYGNSDQAFDGEEWQGQRDVRNKRPPPTPPGFPQQVTSPGPSEVRQQPRCTFLLIQCTTNIVITSHRRCKSRNKWLGLQAGVRWCCLPYP